MQVISVAEALKKLEGKEAFFLDVREIGEYAQGHIEGSLLLPLSECLVAQDFPHDAKKTCIVYCHSGVRSLQAVQKLSKLFPQQSFKSLEGGILSWKRQTEHSIGAKSCSRQFFSVQRQIQIVAGILILSSMATGFFVDSTYFILTLFVGSGLLFAGLSGWCGLGILLSKMPWNK